MEQSKAMEYESRKASSDVLKPRNVYNKGRLSVVILQHLRQNRSFSNEEKLFAFRTVKWWRVQTSHFTVVKRLPGVPTLKDSLLL